MTFKALFSKVDLKVGKISLPSICEPSVLKQSPHKARPLVGRKVAVTSVTVPVGSYLLCLEERGVPLGPVGL